MCKTLDRIRMRIVIVLVSNRIRIGINIEIPIRIRIGINTMPIHNTDVNCHCSSFFKLSSYVSQANISVCYICGKKFFLINMRRKP
jgi:hypothetical protein